MSNLRFLLLKSKNINFGGKLKIRKEAVTKKEPETKAKKPPVTTISKKTTNKITKKKK